MQRTWLLTDIDGNVNESGVKAIPPIACGSRARCAPQTVVAASVGRGWGVAEDDWRDRSRFTAGMTTRKTTATSPGGAIGVGAPTGRNALMRVCDLHDRQAYCFRFPRWPRGGALGIWGRRRIGFWSFWLPRTSISGRCCRCVPQAMGIRRMRAVRPLPAIRF